MFNGHTPKHHSTVPVSVNDRGTSLEVPINNDFPAIPRKQPSGFETQQHLSTLFPKCGSLYVAVTHKWGAFSNLYDESPASFGHSTPICDLSKLVLMQQLIAQGNVWIDVYDVNQHDKSVLSAQVQVMGEVYYYADWVLWVTTAKDDQTLSLISDVDLHDIPSWSAKESARILSWVPARNGDQPEQVGAFEHWTRAWTYQEIALAKEVRALSPYTGRDWSLKTVLKKVRQIWTKLGKQEKVTDTPELKKLRLLIKGCLNDLELVSQARLHDHLSGMDNHRLHREIATSRTATRAKDVLFTHLWTLGIPKGLLDYTKSVEWNIRQFSALLISRGQIRTKRPKSAMGLLDWDEAQAEGDTSVLRLVRLQPLSDPLPVQVLADGKLEVTTRVKQLHGDVWIAYLNKLESVVFLRQSNHIVTVVDSQWSGGETETVAFGAARVVVDTGADVLNHLGWEDGIGWNASFDKALDYLMELRPVIDNSDVYGIIKMVLSTEDAFDTFNGCVFDAVEGARLNGVSEHLIRDAVEILHALCGKCEYLADNGAFHSDFVTSSDLELPSKMYDITGVTIRDVELAFACINKVRHSGVV
ncbi:UNVERIFIED_CONTAM: hypothetical protein HDU68_012635 [Siphonaria sp. JEL0065]|nr:hypothetical protein HDU68_012635 [Siphonaria sp. JEL0065]